MRCSRSFPLTRAMWPWYWILHKICPLWALTRLQPDVRLPSATSAPSSLTKCLQLTQCLSLTCQFPTQHTSLHFFPAFFCFFPRPAKPPLFTAIPNTCSYLLLVHLVGAWEPSSFILSHRQASGNLGPLFHFPPASYKTRNFRLAGYCVCHLFSRWYLARFIRPWRWRWYVPPKCWLTFNRLHGVISQ
jgi:hypothetical protein